MFFSFTVYCFSCLLYITCLLFLIYKFQFAKQELTLDDVVNRISLEDLKDLRFRYSISFIYTYMYSTVNLFIYLSIYLSIFFRIGPRCRIWSKIKEYRQYKHQWNINQHHSFLINRKHHSFFIFVQKEYFKITK